MSEAFLALLSENRVRAQLLSSDALRKVITPKPTYSLDEREVVYASLAYVAKLLTQNGVNVIIDATGNLRRHRDTARRQISRFIEAYLKCPLDICMERERKRKKTYHAPRRIYAQALKRKGSTVPGVGQPYEEPLNPEIVLDASACSPQECAEAIWKRIMRLESEKRSSQLCSRNC